MVFILVLLVILGAAVYWIGGALATGIFLLLILPLGYGPLRRRMIMPSLMSALGRALPQLSPTEQAAIDAGDVGWEGELFKGQPDWARLQAYVPPMLSLPEQEFIDGPLQQLCAELNDWQITHELGDLPESVWQQLKTQGFFGLIIPKQYGGLGFSAAAHSAIIMQIASRSIAAAVTVMVPNSLGPAKLLLKYGTAQQKAHHLPRLAIGEDLPCFALTNPDAGSDAGAIADSGVICRGQFAGENILGIRLNWKKRYITLGPVATLLGLAFHCFDPEHLLGDEDDIGISIALIPTDLQGIDIGRRHCPLDIPFMNGPNQGHNVFIPLDYIIGGRVQLGQGWRMLMESLSSGRAISLPALSVGGAQLMCRASGAYAHLRRQFNLPLEQFEGIQAPLARMAGTTFSMEAVRRLLLSSLSADGNPAVASAIAKYHLTEGMRRVVNDAMDVQGGSAICQGPKNLWASLYQAIPIGITVEGANILTRNMMIFGQGALRCHPYVLAEMQALNQAQNPHSDQSQAIKHFDRALVAHVALFIHNLCYALLTGWFGHLHARLSRSPLTKYRHYLISMSRLFALFTDLSLLTLGGTLKRRERLSARLADMLGELYTLSALLKYFADLEQRAEFVALFQWASDTALYTMQTALQGLLINCPWPRSARVFMRLLLPWGGSFHPPSDRLESKIAHQMATPGALRDELTGGIYHKYGSSALGVLDQALNSLQPCEPLLKRLRACRKNAARDNRLDGESLQTALDSGVINAAEAQRIREAQTLIDQVIAVDDFSFNATFRRGVTPSMPRRAA